MTLPLVALHGFTGSPQSFDGLVQRLKASTSLRIHRPSLLGHSPHASEPCSGFVAEVDRLARGITEAGFSGAHLLGYSLGARLALGLLARHPQLFARATLIGVNPGLRGSQLRLERQWADEKWCKLLSHSLNAFVRKWEAQPIFFEQNQASPQALREQRRIRLQHSARGLQQSLRATGLGQMPDYWSVATDWRRPLTIIVGERDTKFRALANQWLSGVTTRAASAAVLHTIAGVGHNVLLEAPDRLTRVLGL